MAIIKCPECSHAISDKAKSCPNCGYMINNNDDNSNSNTQSSDSYKETVALCVCIAICIVAIIAGVAFISYTQSK